MKAKDILIDTANNLAEIEVNEVVILIRIAKDLGEFKKDSILTLSNISCGDIDHVNAILQEVLRNQQQIKPLNTKVN